MSFDDWRVAADRAFAAAGSPLRCASVPSGAVMTAYNTGTSPVVFARGVMANPPPVPAPMPVQSPSPFSTRSAGHPRCDPAILRLCANCLGVLVWLVGIPAALGVVVTGLGLLTAGRNGGAAGAVVGGIVLGPFVLSVFALAFAALMAGIAQCFLAVAEWRQVQPFP